MVLNKQQESAIQAVEMSVLRQIAEKRRVDRVINVEMGSGAVKSVIVVV